MRCFIALNFSNKTKKELNELTKIINEEKFRKTREQNFHLTMRFLGEKTKLETVKIKKELKKISFNKIEINLNQIGFFGEKIIWISSKEKKELKKISEKLDKIIELKNFQPHVTLARNKNASKKEFIQTIKELKKTKPKIKTTIKTIDLMQSIQTKKGIKYSKI